jgi:predicted unusual protein kinase regulating ubiquinone biosynthesis (AarF/ABC1/UbiB family)
MSRLPGPSLASLAHRAVVLFGLIVQAFVLYVRIAGANRGWWRASPEATVARLHALAVRFVRIAARFKGALIKVGQVASLRVEVLPTEVTDELAKLQDSVAPHPTDEIALQIRRELGRPIDALFASFSESPLASASLGQVHRARTPDGWEVAVKVLYPGVERSVAVDIAMTKLALWGFDFFVAADLMQVYRELRDSILGEMDYVREGRAAEEVRANLADDPVLADRIRIPQIDWSLTRKRVLTMEYIEGVKINDAAAMAARGFDVDEHVRQVSRAFCHMMFRDGFFHCDPHPGNILVDAEGRIGLIDFGMNQRIAPEVLAALRRNVLASFTRDADLYAWSLVEAGAIDPGDVPVVKELAEVGFDPAYYNLTPQEVANLDLGKYFDRTREQLKKIRSFRLPAGIVMWSRAISLLYALMVELAPGIRPLEVFGPYVMEFLRGAAKPEEAPPVDPGDENGPNGVNRIVPEASKSV